MRDGSLDYTLLQPANSLFLVSFTRIVVWRVWDLVLAVVLIVIGHRHERRRGTPLATCSAFLLLTVSGAAIIYSLWIVLIAFTFWFIKFDNNVTILQALLDAGPLPGHGLPALAAPDRDLRRADRRGDHRAAAGAARRPDRGGRSCCSSASARPA